MLLCDFEWFFSVKNFNQFIEKISNIQLLSWFYVAFSAGLISDRVDHKGQGEESSGEWGCQVIQSNV